MKIFLLLCLATVCQCTDRGVLTSLFSHVLGLERKVANVSFEMKATKSDQQATKAKLQRTELDLEATKSDLRGTKADLEATRRELASVKSSVGDNDQKLTSVKDALEVMKRKLFSVTVYRCTF